MLIGFFLSTFFRLRKKKKIILIGGNLGEKFDDNSKYMYSFLQVKKTYDVYWCQKCKNKLDQSIDNFLIIGSVKSYVLYFMSDIVYFTHSISTDICPVAARVTFFQPFKVYLSHGVEGLKKRMDTKLEFADFYPCTNMFEYELKNKEWGIAKCKLSVTGIARYDGLYNKIKVNNEKMSKILYMPTWREWDYGLSVEEFCRTESFKNLKQVCENVELKKYLEKTGMKLVVRLHPFVSAYLEQLKLYFSLDNIILNNDDIGDLVESCDALITDYSSISWDFLYLRKPVLFFQYDLGKYLEKRGSYLKIPDQLFGPKAFSVKELVKNIETINELNYSAEDSYRSDFFEFFDNQNCRRIFEMTRSKEREK